MPLSHAPQFGVPLFAGLLAGLITYTVNTVFNIKSSQNDLVKDYIDDLKSIETLSIEYWLGNHEGEEEKIKLTKVGHELRARLASTGYFVNRARSNGAVVAQYAKRFKELDGKLFDLATGGNFQTAKMTADAATASEIVNVLSEIKSILRESKVSRYWAH